MVNNEHIKPALAKKCFIPIPIELMAIVGGTLVSMALQLVPNYGVQAIGHIPTGFPTPEMPRFELFNELLLDAFTIAIVSYTVSVSMALLFAQRLNYEVDFNQELLAMGSGNVIGSFFSCMPVAVSMSRSYIQESVGGRTQVASLVSCLILTVVLLWVGPFFEPLPRVGTPLKLSFNKHLIARLNVLVRVGQCYCCVAEGHADAGDAAGRLLATQSVGRARVAGHLLDGRHCVY